jgi:Bacterial type III secretion protein (HrpB4)
VSAVPGRAPDAAGVAALADASQALARRLDDLRGGLDPHWRMRLQPGLEFVCGIGARRVSPRVCLAAFVSLCGPLPALPALATPAGRWSLLPCAALQARLCALALALRPGVLRACVRREARKALAHAIGPAFAPLQCAPAHGAALPAGDAARSPQDWAWTGFRDVARCGLWPARSVRRRVVLALPPRAKRAPVAASVCVSPPALLQTMARVDAWFDESPAGDD